MTSPLPLQPLRDRIAAAIGADIRRAAMPLKLLPGQIGHLGARTEYDLADAALAVMQPELDQLRAALTEARDTLVAAAPTLEAAQDAADVLEAVSALHKPVRRGALTICDECSPARSDGASRYVLVPWPCNTARVIDPAAVSAPTN